MNSRFFEEPREGPGTRTGPRVRHGAVAMCTAASGQVGLSVSSFKFPAAAAVRLGPGGSLARRPGTPRRVGTARDPEIGPEFPPVPGRIGKRPDSRFPIPDSRPIGNRESGNPPQNRENGGSDFRF